MRGQRRLHFHKEGNGRRKQILDAVTTLGIKAIIYDGSRHKSDKLARDACLARLIRDMVAINAERLVVEVDDPALKTDRALIYAHLRDANCTTLQYAHMRAYEECLLALPDAIAWCWARGGSWRARVSEVVVEVRRV